MRRTRTVDATRSGGLAQRRRRSIIPGDTGGSRRERAIVVCVGLPNVTVAIPTLNAGPRFGELLEALAEQTIVHELLVCDSGSGDATTALARARGARLIEIPRSSFSHGATRNLLMAQGVGAHVAFLTQDAVPASPGWLSRLLSGFELAPEVGLVFGPYLPRPDASPSVAREVTAWFQSFTDDGRPRIDALESAQRDAPARRFLGHRGFFTDANGCISRAAWEQVPFRAVAYAEDHLLAQDMLRAGYAKVYVPDAAVIHSHEYSPWQWLRRSFDEARAVQEIYGEVPAGTIRSAGRSLRANLAADVRWVRARSPATSSSRAMTTTLTHAAAHHGARAAGTVLGASAAHLPHAVTERLSLERRR
jgi:GT2 family glycosyltransferase